MLKILLRISFWITVFLTVVMALIPATPIIKMDSGDKYLHIIAFFTLTIFARITYPRQSMALILFQLLILGALIEILQLIPFLNRDGDIYDWLADAFAVIVGSLLLYGYSLVVRIVRRD